MGVRRESGREHQPGDSGNDLRERMQDSNEKVPRRHKSFIST